MSPATFSLIPWVIPVVGESVNEVVVETVETLPQFVARLFALTVPSPAVMSYPAVAVHASVVVWPGSTRTPLLPAVLTLQFGEPPWHGTLLVPTPDAPVGKTLFPFVTSLKTQPAASVALEVQLAPAFFARAYST